MPTQGSSREVIWITGGVLALALLFFAVTFYRRAPEPSAQFASQARRLELVNAMRIALAAASEAQNSAVMSTSEQDSELFAGQARAAKEVLERGRIELEELTTKRDDRQEMELMERVVQSLQEFGRIDKQLIEMALQNSNRKAYDLAFGPAAKTLQDMDAALSHIQADNAESNSENVRQILQSASDTRISALRIQVLLLPHIASESDRQMDEFEAQIAEEEQVVREGLAALAELLPSKDSTNISTATSRYAEFEKLKSQIIQLSRENTDVKAVALALNEKRVAMIDCQDALADLGNAIHTETIKTPIPSAR